jgi:hypothetical protein
MGKDMGLAQDRRDDTAAATAAVEACLRNDLRFMMETSFA